VNRKLQSSSFNRIWKSIGSKKSNSKSKPKLQRPSSALATMNTKSKNKRQTWNAPFQNDSLSELVSDFKKFKDLDDRLKSPSRSNLKMTYIKQTIKIKSKSK